MAVQSEIHWWQNAYQNRFQEYAPDYEQGQVTAGLIDLSSIDKVPVSMLVGTEDQTCSYA